MFMPTEGKTIFWGIRFANKFHSHLKITREFNLKYLVLVSLENIKSRELIFSTAVACV